MLTISSNNKYNKYSSTRTLEKKKRHIYVTVFEISLCCVLENFLKKCPGGIFFLQYGLNVI